MSDILFSIRNLRVKYGAGNISHRNNSANKIEMIDSLEKGSAIYEESISGDRLGNNKTARNKIVTVLSVPHLDIPRGKTVFVIGDSGSGKSTFLEILGLMNNHYTRDAEIIFYPESGKNGFDYNFIWENEERVTHFRREYFCFMFQATKLFPQFNIFGNIVLSSVIHNKKRLQAHEDAMSIMNEINIKDEAGKSVKVVSGGELQRTAFCQAMATGSPILFADEPTGNIDASLAHRMIKYIKEYIEKDSEVGKRSAIIISHDIDLAAEYAEFIVIIQKNHLVLQKNTIDVADLKCKSDSERIKTIKSKILSAMSSENGLSEDTYPVQVDNGRNPCVRDYPIRKHDDREFKKFYGPASTRDFSWFRKRNWYLTILLLIVFSAIGFSSGSLNVLDEKMNDPFVRLICMDVPFHKREKLPDILLINGDDKLKSEYKIHNISGYLRFPLAIFDKSKNGTSVPFGRTLSYDDPVLHELYKNMNVVDGSLFTNKNDIGIVVTERFLNKYGYEKGKDAFIYLSMYAADTLYKVPIPIRGIAKNLPGKSDFVVTPYFYEVRLRDSPFSPMKSRNVNLFVEGDSVAANNIVRIVDDYIANNTSIDKNNYDVFIDESKISFKPFIKGRYVRAFFIDPLEWSAATELSSAIEEECKNRNFKVTRVFDYPTAKIIDFEDFNRVLIHVNSLDKVHELREMFIHNYEIEIDMANIESLENYNFVTRLTQSLSIIISIISIITLSIFIFNLLYIHLYKNRLYLGLLKAFGIMSASLKNIYMSRMLRTVIYSTGTALVIAAIIGYTGMVRRLLSLFFTMDSQYTYFDLANWMTFIFIVLTIVVSVLSINSASIRILKYTPADLIDDNIDE